MRDTECGLLTHFVPAVVISKYFVYFLFIEGYSRQRATLSPDRQSWSESKVSLSPKRWSYSPLSPCSSSPARPCPMAIVSHCPSKSIQMALDSCWISLFQQLPNQCRARDLLHDVRHTGMLGVPKQLAQAAPGGRRALDALAPRRRVDDGRNWLLF